MGCCGGRARQTKAGKAPAPTGLPGAGGAVKLEYLGKKAFAQRGSKTGTHYRFGPDRPKGYVDKEDAVTLLELSEDGELLFRPLGSLRPPNRHLKFHL